MKAVRRAALADKGFESVLQRVEHAAAYVSAASFVIIVCITVTDVVLRYVVHRPLMWAYDFISWYPMVALFFFAIADSWASGHHVRVDVLIRHLGNRARAALNVLSALVALGIMLLIAYTGLRQFLESFDSQERLTGVVEWLLWPSKLMVPVGAALFCVRLLADIVHDLLVLGGAPLRPTHLRGHGTLRAE